jgi:precorrin-6A/cobalt-precorrin-6A reductase
VLADLTALRQLDLTGERLLLAIGGRHLAQAVACSPGALHHARVLPAAAGLQWAHGAGLSAERIACLRPRPDFAVEQALLRRWRITTILCRQSGGLTEAGWRHVAARQGCRLLVLARPVPEPGPDPDQVPLSMQALLARLESLGSAPGDGRSDGGPDHRG